MPVVEIVWEELAFAVGFKGHRVLRITLREQTPLPRRVLGGPFRVTVHGGRAPLYDCAGMDECRAQAAFDANIKMARREGYSVFVTYLDRVQ